MWWMLRASNGKRDAMLTFAVGGFILSGLSIVVGVIDKIEIGSFSLILRAPDVTLVTAFLGATLISYVTRRNTKDKLDAKERELILNNNLGVINNKNESSK